MQKWLVTPASEARGISAARQEVVVMAGGHDEWQWWRWWELMWVVATGASVAGMQVLFEKKMR